MREVTGRHVLGITVSAFAVIIGVNLTLAYKAVSTFPGLEVGNSYVASQEFNARRDAQLALGWTLTHAYASGRLHLGFTDTAGHPVEVRDLTVLIGRTTEAADDVMPAFAWLNGHYEAEVALKPGNWLLRVTATAADGTLFEQRQSFSVRAGE